jgi:3-phosphoglycerate kinase
MVKNRMVGSRVRGYKVLLNDWQLVGASVLCRADLNVPVDTKGILDDFRLISSLPTIDFLLERGASICLITHLGRPKNPLPIFSTARLIPFFRDRGYVIEWAETIAAAKHLQQTKKYQLMLLENLRFTPYEQGQDLCFAQQLAQLGTYFVQDAFGSLAHAETSIIQLPTLFSETHRTIGLLVEREIQMLEKFRSCNSAEKLLIIGGIKVAEKIKYLQSVLENMDTILLLPPLAATFMAAQQKEVGTTPVFPEYFDLCRSLVAYAAAHGKALIIPEDFQIKRADGSYCFVDQSAIQKDDALIGLGPRSCDLYCSMIKKTSSVFITGLCGFIDRPESFYTARTLLDAAMRYEKDLIVAGGDSVGLVRQMYGDNTQSIKFSTGGSASLCYVATGNLVGLEPFSR